MRVIKKSAKRAPKAKQYEVTAKFGESNTIFMVVKCAASELRKTLKRNLRNIRSAIAECGDERHELSY